MPKDPTAAVRDNADLPKSPYAVTLQGQPSLITGASSAIRKATALGLVQAGADIVVNYSGDSTVAENVVHYIGGFGSRAIASEADVSKEDQFQGMFAKTIDHFGKLRVVVSNERLQRATPFDKITTQQWQTVIGVNLTRQFLAAREAVREFKKRGVVKNISVAADKIVCISSVLQEIPWT